MNSSWPHLLSNFCLLHLSWFFLNKNNNFIIIIIVFFQSQPTYAAIFTSYFLSMDGKMSQD